MRAKEDGSNSRQVCKNACWLNVIRCMTGCSYIGDGHDKVLSLYCLSVIKKDSSSFPRSQMIPVNFLELRQTGNNRNSKVKCVTLPSEPHIQSKSSTDYGHQFMCIKQKHLEKGGKCVFMKTVIS